MSKLQEKIRVSEVFPSIQGEGSFIGYPMLFIRVSGCTRSCSYCDTKYHNKGMLVSKEDLIDEIRQYPGKDICFTGGEPLLYKNAIFDIIQECTRQKFHKYFHLETNGDLLVVEDCIWFRYIAISPKDKKIAENAATLFLKKGATSVIDIKVVTDLKTVGKDLLEYATMLMPLTKKDDIDNEVARDVWMYCVAKSIRFSPRMHISVWGKSLRGV